MCISLKRYFIETKLDSKHLNRLSAIVRVSKKVTFLKMRIFLGNRKRGKIYIYIYTSTLYKVTTKYTHLLL